MKRVYTLLILSIFGVPSLSTAQTVLFEDYIDSIQPIPPSEESIKGMDAWGMYICYGTSVNTGQRELKSGVSGIETGFGFFHRAQVSPIVSVMFNLRVDYFENRYRLGNTDSLNIELKNQSTRWTIADFAIGPMLHIPSGSKTYNLGINAFGGYLLDRRISERYEASTGETIITEIIRFDTNNRWVYGLSASVGRGRHWLSVNYRLSDLRGGTQKGIIGNFVQVRPTPLLVSYNLGVSF